MNLYKTFIIFIGSKVKKKTFQFNSIKKHLIIYLNKSLLSIQTM